MVPLTVMLVNSRATFSCSATNVIVLPVALLEHPATSRLLSAAPVLVVVDMAIRKLTGSHDSYG